MSGAATLLDVGLFRYEQIRFLKFLALLNQSTLDELTFKCWSLVLLVAVFNMFTSNQKNCSRNEH